MSKSGYFRIFETIQKIQRNNNPLVHQINFDNRVESPNIESRLFVRIYLKKKKIILSQIAIFINPQTNTISKKYTAIGMSFDEYFKIENLIDTSESLITTTVFESYGNDLSMGFFEKN